MLMLKSVYVCWNPITKRYATNFSMKNEKKFAILNKLYLILLSCTFTTNNGILCLFAPWQNAVVSPIKCVDLKSSHDLQKNRFNKIQKKKKKEECLANKTPAWHANKIGYYCVWNTRRFWCNDNKQWLFRINFRPINVFAYPTEVFSMLWMPSAISVSSVQIQIVG